MPQYLDPKTVLIYRPHPVQYVYCILKYRHVPHSPNQIWEVWKGKYVGGPLIMNATPRPNLNTIKLILPQQVQNGVNNSHTGFPQIWGSTTLTQGFHKYGGSNLTQCFHRCGVNNPHTGFPYIWGLTTLKMWGQQLSHRVSTKACT